jgi:hypothetical protein
MPSFARRDGRDARPHTLLDAELFAGFGAEAFGGPGGFPDYVDIGVADAGKLLDAGFDLSADVYVLGTPLGGEGHVDGDVLLALRKIVEADVVDESKIDNVDGDFGVVALLKGV